MAEIYFPDGTKLSELAINTGNLLAGLTPTFTGWTQNPGTNAQLVDELVADSLTTQGIIPADSQARIQYDLGSSKRITFYTRADPSQLSTASVWFSDDGSDFRGQNFVYTKAAGDNFFISVAGKTRYIRLNILNQHTGTTAIINFFTMRAYLL